ncbi:MAG: carotenoid oxygenase family protein [Alphaproteobacteria bacterium]|nr:carotenoid oxygenase family protein [Alphaproteobacteria bacterium]
MTTRRDLLIGGAALGLASALPSRADAAFYSAEALNAVLLASPGALDLELPVEGRLPEALSGGSYVLNGPGQLQVGGQTLHPFDGHGYLRAFHFGADGRVRLRARFVRTDVFEEELAAGHVTRRGVGSLVAYKGERRWARTNREAKGRRNVANTTVIAWGGELLCGWEGGRPTAVAPDSLDTLGLEDFGGALGEGPFLAHVRLDARRDRLIGLSMTLGPETRFTFHELGPDKRELSRQEMTRPGASFQHDFAISDGYYVLTDNPLKLSPGGLIRMLRGRGPMLGAIRAADAEGKLLLLPRAGGAPIEVPLGRPMWAIHHLNAWEEGGHVVLLTCAFDAMSFGEEFGYQGPHQPFSPAGMEGARPQQLLRIEVDPATATLKDLRALHPNAVDFPRVRPDAEGVQLGWGVAASRWEEGPSFPFDSLVSVRLDDAGGVQARWSAEGRFVGEPLLVPEGEAGGVALSMVHEPGGGRCRLCAFDVTDLGAGPLAQVEVPTLLPYGFHGGWVPAA